MPQYDVIIIGAGPAGSTAAFFLGQAGKRVLLLDQASFPRDKTCGDGLTPRALRMLAQMGLLDAVCAAGQSIYSASLRLDDHCQFSLQFADPAAADPASRMVILPRMTLDQLLLDHALANGAVTFRPDKVVQVSHEPNPQVRLQSGETLHANCVVLATGANTLLQRQAGLLDAKPAVVHAARCYVSGLKPCAPQVDFFFDQVDLPGYGWVFPTSETSANIGCGIFVPGPGQSERLKQILAQHPLITARMTEHTEFGPVKAAPIRTDFKAEYAGRPGLLVTGEALGVVNPLSGEGIDYAIETGRFVAQSLIAHAEPQQAFRHYRKALKSRFGLKFPIYRLIVHRYMAAERIPGLLHAARNNPGLQKLFINGLFGQLKARDLLTPHVLLDLWSIRASR